MKNEEWRDVVGFESAYQVSSEGKIRSKDRIIPIFKGRRLHVDSQIMGTSVDRCGYEKIVLKYQGLNKTTGVHRVVAQAFLNNPKNLPQVNHKNMIKTDNRLENLEWISRRDNILHALDFLARDSRRNFNRKENPYSMPDAIKSDGEEMWSAIDECDYEISSKGIVKKLAHFALGRVYPEKIIKGSINGRGHLKVVLPISGTGVKSVHQLVAIYFIENPNKEKNIIHLDGNKLNNDFKNLKWASLKEIAQFYSKIFRRRSGEGSFMSKLTNNDVLDIRTLVAFGASRLNLSKAFGVNLPTVRSIIKRKSWVHI